MAAPVKNMRTIFPASVVSDVVSTPSTVVVVAGGGVVPVGPPATLPLPGTGAIFLSVTTGGPNQVPAMTSNAVPYGVCSANSYYYATPPYLAFQAPGTSYGWLNNGDGLPTWLQYQFPVPHTIGSYAVTPWSTDNFPTRSPITWLLQGSNDGSTWTTLDSRSGIAGTWVSHTANTYVMTTIGAYMYYRIYVTANGGNVYTGIDRFTLNASVYTLNSITSEGIIKTF